MDWKIHRAILIAAIWIAEVLSAGICGFIAALALIPASYAARYKALGNSIAIPPWKWVLKRLCAIYERDATMASLFDGIGGFPYIWEQLNGKGSCLWASEIEPFPIAVTKYHFGEE